MYAGPYARNGEDAGSDGRAGPRVPAEQPLRPEPRAGSRCSEREFRTELEAAARGGFGEPAFAEARAEGRSLPVEQVVRDALRWAGLPAMCCLSAALPGGQRDPHV